MCAGKPRDGSAMGFMEEKKSYTNSRSRWAGLVAHNPKRDKRKPK